MNCVLCIETATRPCSVALIVKGVSLFEKEEMKGPSHASLLGVFVKEALAFAEINNFKLDAVAVSCGPGSYTGLRIGVSLAKGLCFGLNVPLIPIQTLKLLASTVATSQQWPEKTLLCPMIDARRMEVFAAIYSPSLQLIKPISADIIDENSYADYRTQGDFYFFGDGASKCIEKLEGERMHYIEAVNPLAKNMYPLIEAAEKRGEILADPAYFEPFYLKDFVATQSKKSLL